MEEYQLVQEILEREIQTSKAESSVYFLLGKTYAKLGKTKDAIIAMTFAQDYSEHKSSNIIKDEIEKLFSSEDEVISPL